MAPDISAHSASRLLRKLREWKQENIGKARNLRIWQALGSTSLTLSEKRKLVRRKPIPKALREILGAEPTNESVEQLERDLQSRATTQLVEPQGQIAKSQAETPPSDQQPSNQQGSQVLPTLPENVPQSEAEATPGVAEGAEDPVFTHSLDYRSIRFNGMCHTLTRNQAAITKILHEAFKRGTPSVGKSELLAAVESETSRIQDSFKRSPLWKTLVVSGERRGTYRLNLPEP